RSDVGWRLVACDEGEQAATYDAGTPRDIGEAGDRDEAFRPSALAILDAYNEAPASHRQKLEVGRGDGEAAVGGKLSVGERLGSGASEVIDRHCPAHFWGQHLPCDFVG